MGTRHDEWYGDALAQLRAGSGDEEWARRELDLARQAVREDAGSPDVLFGTPKEYARARLDDRPPVTVDASARRAHVERARGAVGAVGGLGVVSTVRMAWVDGWSTESSGRAVVLGGGLIAALLVAGVAPPLLRLTGRPRAATAAFVSGVALAPLTIALVLVLPRGGDALTIPTPLPAVALVGLALAVWALAVRPVARAAERAASGDADDDWFAGLAGLLEGRHDLDRRTARALAAQAREHWTLARADHLAGARPDVEFGSPVEYAADLAAGRRTRPPWWARRGLWAGVGGVALAAMALRSVYDGSAAWEVALRSLLAVLVLAGAAADLRLGRRTSLGTVVDG